MSKRVSNRRKKSYFGLSALIVALLSTSFLAASVVIAELNITPEVFNFWNNLTVIAYLLTVPLALILGFLATARENDSKGLGIAALTIAGIPLLVIFLQMLASFFG